MSNNKSIRERFSTLAISIEQLTEQLSWKFIGVNRGCLSRRIDTALGLLTQDHMSITNCPMCQILLPAETEKNCGSCGADLSRWIKGSKEPQEAPVRIDHIQAESRQSARNGLYCVAGIFALPPILFAGARFIYSSKAALDSSGLVLIAVLAILCILAMIAAVKCGAGNKSGRIWAFLPVWALMFCFPIGTIVAYMAHTRLGEAELE